MAARDGMLWLIGELRAACDIGTADYTVSGTAYWTDEQIQTQLEFHRTDLNRVPLRYEPEYASGEASYLDYYAPIGNLEDASSGSDIWQVEDSNGDAVGTADYTANYQNGHIRFDADTGGTLYYLRARSYQLDRAAARIWRKKAAHYVTAYDFAADNQRFNRSQMQRAAMVMAQEFDRKAGILTAQMVRTDLW